MHFKVAFVHLLKNLRILVSLPKIEMMNYVVFGGSEACQRVQEWNKNTAFYRQRRWGPGLHIGIEMGKVHEVWETKQ